MKINIGGHMKILFQIHIILIICISYFGYSQYNPQNDKLTKIETTKETYFIENKGQWNDDILAAAQQNGINTIITKDGIVYDMYKIEKNENISESSYIKRGIVNKMKLIGALSSNLIINSDGMPYFNYFYGNKPEKWVTNARAGKSVVLKEIYPNIDAMIFLHDGFPRYDFIIKPGADPNHIMIKFEGPGSYKIACNGELQIETSMGTITHGKLYAYQIINGETKKIDCKYAKRGEYFVFDIREYDKNNTLIIDPMVMTSFIGGSSKDVITSIAYQKPGHIFVGGWTESTDLQTTAGAYQKNYEANRDGFISKFLVNASKHEIVFTTYIGTSDHDEVRAITADVNKNIYLACMTKSRDFPMVNSFNNTYFGEFDVVIMKINPDGNNIIWSGYFGGSKDDIPNCIAINQGEQVYVAGETYSSNIITREPAYNTNKGQSDVFLVRISSTGQSILNSTYYGGSQRDAAYAMDIDDKDNVYVTGETFSGNIPVVPWRTGGWGGNTVYERPFDNTANGGSDAFIVKFRGSGTSVEYSTYFGGSANDVGKAIIANIDGSVFIAGNTQKETISPPTFPVSDIAFQAQHKGGTDIFIARVSKIITSTSQGQTFKRQELEAGTYLGGTKDEDLCSIQRFQTQNQLYVIGSTNSNNFPIIGDKTNKYYGQKDIFVCELSINLNALTYSNYYGGNKDDVPTAVVMDEWGHLIIAGYTASENFDFQGRKDLQKTYGGGESDGFIFKLTNFDLSLNYPSGNENLCTGGNFKIEWSSANIPLDSKFDIELMRKSIKYRQLIAEGITGRTYNWNIPKTIPDGNDYIIRVSHESGIMSENITPISILSAPVSVSVTAFPEDTKVCENTSIRFVASAQGSNINYQWRFNGVDIKDANMPELIINGIKPSQAGDYTVKITNLCPPEIVSTPIKVIVIEATKVTEHPRSATKKENESVTFSIKAKGSNLKYQWQKDGFDLLNETKSTLTLQSLKLLDAGDYRCIVTGECYADTSEIAKLIVEPAVSVFDSPDLNSNLEFTLKIIDNNEKNSFIAQISSPIECNIELKLFDNLGRIVNHIHSEYIYKGLNNLTINTFGLNTGIYWLVAECNGQRLARKLMIIE